MDATLQTVAEVAGLSLSGSAVRSGSEIIHSVALPAAKAGLLTRSDPNTGVVTCAEGHGFEDADVVDVYWDGGIRYGMTADVTVNAVTIDGGAGDDLPAAAATPVTLSKQVVIDTDFDGDLLTLIAIACDCRAHVDIQKAGAVSLLALEIPEGELWSWITENGYANPLTGDPVDVIKASNGDSAAAATLKIGVVYDAT